MGSLYRSEEMCLVNVYLQAEAAYTCVSELGELGLVQFQDLNATVNSFQRKFVSEVRRCDEMERKLRFFEKEMKRDDMFGSEDGVYGRINPPAPAVKDMIELEAKLEKFESDMKEVNKNQEKLRQNFRELTELKHILRKAQIFFEEAHTRQESDSMMDFVDDDESQASLLANMESSTHQHPITTLSFVAGVIARERIVSFEKVLWRACRGNVFLKHAEIDGKMGGGEKGDEEEKKNVFIIFFQGEQLKARVKNICAGFHGTLYPCPETNQERREIAIGVMTRIEDLQTVLHRTEEHRRLILTQVAHDIKKWFIMVGKMKSIYHTLNMFNVNLADKCLIGEGWCAKKHVDQIRFALRQGTEASGSSVPSILQTVNTKLTPPTYHITNNFTQGFQTIIDAYGVSSYREINPTPFTIITFPFLFAVMFGDLGHGLIMFLFASYLVYNQRQFLQQKTNNEIWNMMFGGRYMILLMGFFSMYTGFLYNECFSRSLNIFGSAWNVSNIKDIDKLLNSTDEIELDPFHGGAVWSGTPYLYGMDPVWQSAENKITFQNSYKMKSAIVMGMSQMLFGLVLAYKNIKFFGDRLSFYCEWIPQMIFLWCIVGYLCLLIVMKWLMRLDPNKAPSLLIGIINMFMFQPPAPGTELFAGQGTVQNLLVVVAGVCVPWMLLLKPYILHKRHGARKSTNGNRYASVSVDVDDTTPLELIGENGETDSNDSATIDKEEFNFGEVMIYQIIHTIEYCLNCISHTASYLRLWALSLAHSELSEVLWNMVMSIGLTSFPQHSFMGGVMTFAIFAFFAALTVGILLLMEGLSAFLHALRLHWVEFQVKFYKGQGTQFQPFCFRTIIQEQQENAAT